MKAYGVAYRGTEEWNRDWRTFDFPGKSLEMAEKYYRELLLSGTVVEIKLVSMDEASRRHLEVLKYQKLKQP